MGTLIGIPVIISTTHKCQSEKAVCSGIIKKANMSYQCEHGLSSLGCGVTCNVCRHGQQGGGWNEEWCGQVVQGVTIQPALKLLHAPADG